MVANATSKPVASVTIEPIGFRGSKPREHSISVLLRLSAGEPKHADQDCVEAVARKALAGFPPAKGEADRRRIYPVSISRKSSKPGSVTSVVVGVEGQAVSPVRPGDEPIDGLRDALLEEGYRVTVREKRECAEPSCKTSAVVDWSKSSDVPAGWHSNLICGGHNYRTCSGCQSTYLLTSMNAAGHAPSVHCEVCGLVMIEWGSSKIWTAELVSRA